MTSSNNGPLPQLLSPRQADDQKLAALTRSQIDLSGLVQTAPHVLDLLRIAHRILNLDPTRAGIMIQQASDLLVGADEKVQLLPVPKPRLLKGGLAPWQYRNVEVFITAHLTIQIRLEDLAAVTKLSVSHFSRAFKVCYAEAPYSYIMRKRIELSQMLMLTTDETLCQIAALCGLADQAHLSNLFRRYVGMSPLAWRRMSRPATTSVFEFASP